MQVRSIAAVAVLTLLVVTVGCARGGRTLVGRTAEDEDAFVATVVQEDGQVVAYFCDGTDGAVGQRAWLKGTSTGDALDITTDRFQLVGQGSFGGLTGSITDDDGATHTFRLEEVSGDAGLYRASGSLGEETDYEAGWIVLPDGSQRGALGVTGRPSAGLGHLDVRARRATILGVGTVKVVNVAETVKEESGVGPSTL